MRNQIVSRGNHWIIERGKDAPVCRPRSKFYFHQYLETTDGVIVPADLTPRRIHLHVSIKTGDG